MKATFATVGSTIRFGPELLSGYQKIVHRASKPFTCEPRAQGGNGGLVLFRETSWIAQAEVLGMSPILRNRLLPGCEVLSFVAVAVLNFFGEFGGVMLLVLYEHVQQYLRTHLTVDYLVTLATALNFHLPETAPTPAEFARLAHAKLDLRTIRSARGATCSTAILLVHQRYSEESGAHGQWFDDPGLRRVAFSRARDRLLVIGDTRLENDTSLPRERIPGLKALGEVWPMYRQENANPLRISRANPLLASQAREWGRLQWLQELWNLRACTIIAATKHHLSTLGTPRPRSDSRAAITSTLHVPKSREDNATMLFAALQARQDARLTPGVEEVAARKEVLSFNSREVADEMTSLDAWLSIVPIYAVPAVHWQLAGRVAAKKDEGRGFPHLVSLPFFGKFHPWSPHVYDEHLQLAKLLCPIDHELCIQRHKAQTVATEHTLHYWKECRSERFAVAIRRKVASADRPSVRLYAYYGMGSKRMLDCLSSVVLRIADFDMACHVARVLGKHWRHYGLKKEHVVVWEDEPGDSLAETLFRAWQEGRAQMPPEAPLAHPVSGPPSPLRCTEPEPGMTEVSLSDSDDGLSVRAPPDPSVPRDARRPAAVEASASRPPTASPSASSIPPPGSHVRPRSPAPERERPVSGRQCSRSPLPRRRRRWGD